MMRNDCFKKALVFGIIVLFMGLAFQPAVSKTEPEEVTIEPKDYLFQTIIDINNHPDVKDLFEQLKDKGEVFSFDYNLRNVCLKLLFWNPRLLRSLLFTKPSMTFEYLDSTFNRGCEVVNIIGEDEALAMIESIKITYPEFFEDLNFIIMNDEELSNRISILKEMNEKLNHNALFSDWPVICTILLLIIIPIATTVFILALLSEIFKNIPILAETFYNLACIVEAMLFIPGGLALFVFECFGPPYP